MASYYNAKNQKEYNEKNAIFSVKYIGTSESELIVKIENAIESSGLSKQAWIKSAIIEKLQREGYFDQR